MNFYKDCYFLLVKSSFRNRKGLLFKKRLFIYVVDPGYPTQKKGKLIYVTNINTQDFKSKQQTTKCKWNVIEMVLTPCLLRVGIYLLPS